MAADVGEIENSEEKQAYRKNSITEKRNNMKKIVCLVLTFALVSAMSVTVFAQEEMSKGLNADSGITVADEISNVEISPEEIQIFSKEYPNAYFEKKVIPFHSNDFAIQNGELITKSTNFRIKQFVEHINDNPQQLEEVTTQFSKGNSLIATIEATAYVNETYAKKDDQLVCVDSRLLSYEELINKSNGSIKPLDLELIDSDGDKKYSLTINLNVYTGSGKERYILAGTATWLEGNTYSGGRPASGDDYIGFTWGGKFDFTKEGCIVSQNRDETKLLSATKSDVLPNSGIVWSFP